MLKSVTQNPSDTKENPNPFSDAQILIVDDDRILHGIVGKFLKRSNFNFESVYSAEEALEYVKETTPDLILSDIVMPEMDGIEFCQKLRTLSNCKEIPVIFFTGLSDSDTLSKAFEVGANDYVVKPLRQTEVLSRVKRHLSEYFRKREDNKKINTLDKANKSKTQFLGVASHDLRNPLVSIRGISQYLESEKFGKLNDAQKELTNTIIQASETMLSLVEDLLDVSKLESDQLKLDCKTLDLAEIIKTRVILHSASAERKDIELSQNISASNSKAYLDETLISRVIDNLVTNALKFSPPATQVEILLEDIPNGIRLIVQDEGPGIPEDEFNKLFKEFSRTSNLPTAGESSSGIGLYVCKRIVDSHNGTISVENRDDGGARFIINFKPPVKLMYQNITALIADDEAHMRTFMKLVLMDLGISKIYLMQNGMDAIEAYNEYNPDIVLMDINMNKMNGLEALETIVKQNPNAVVVMMTAVSTREAVKTSSAKGAAYYILKTQSPEVIKEKITEVLDTFFGDPTATEIKATSDEQ